MAETRQLVDINPQQFIKTLGLNGKEKRWVDQHLEGKSKLQKIEQLKMLYPHEFDDFMQSRRQDMIQSNN